MDDAVEVVARAIFNASIKNAGRTVLWTEDDASWPQEHTRDEARQCARAAMAADPLRVAVRGWRENNECSPTPDGVYIMVPARYLDELLAINRT